MSTPIRLLRFIVLFSAFYGLVLGTTPAYAQSKNGFDYSDALVPAAQIYWGGVARDGIPSIDNPRFVAAHEATSTRKTDRVLGVHRNGIAKAYPVRILERHEVVNDRFGDETIIVTYCPLCFSGMSFSMAADSVARTFGVSGLLYNSDVLLYDRQTGSLWSQIMSTAISGPLKDTKMTPIATAHTSWREWRGRHPDTLLLSTDTGYRINYRSPAYQEYERSRQTMFPVANRNSQYSNKERVLGVSLGNTFKAYPFKELREHDQASFQDDIDGTTLTIHWNSKESYARATGADDKEIPTVIVYWFAWYAFHPNTIVFQAGSG